MEVVEEQTSLEGSVTSSFFLFYLIDPYTRPSILLISNWEEERK